MTLIGKVLVPVSPASPPEDSVQYRRTGPLGSVGAGTKTIEATAQDVGVLRTVSTDPSAPSR